MKNARMSAIASSAPFGLRSSSDGHSSERTRERDFVLSFFFAQNTALFPMEADLVAAVRDTVLEASRWSAPGGFVRVHML